MLLVVVSDGVIVLSGRELKVDSELVKVMLNAGVITLSDGSTNLENGL